MATPKEFKNRRAYHDYHVLDKIEAGIVLIGSVDPVIGDSDK